MMTKVCLSSAGRMRNGGVAVGVVAPPYFISGSLTSKIENLISKQFKFVLAEL